MMVALMAFLAGSCFTRAIDSWSRRESWTLDGVLTVMLVICVIARIS